MKEKKETLLSVAEVSKSAEISRQRVLQLIESGSLQAEKVGRNYVIRQSDYDSWIILNRTVGRPPKTSENDKKE